MTQISESLLAMNRLTQHVVSFSGGAASFATAHLVIEKYGPEAVTLAFCDTLIEDEDLYRFVVEGAAALYGLTMSDRLQSESKSVPPPGEVDRAAYLSRLADQAMTEIPKLVWLSDGRDPWQVFMDRRYQGNTRTAHCTVELKGKVFASWLTETFPPEATTIYFGFDWTETHRLEEARKNWAPYLCEAPLGAPPYLSRSQVFQTVDDYDIELPRLYAMDFAHNNCGGFCVRAGQGHYENLFRKMPSVYRYHEAKQEQLMRDLPTARPFLRLVRNKVTNYLTLKQFREHLESGGEFNAYEIGGCGCFSDASAGGLSQLIATDSDVDNDWLAWREMVLS